MISSSGPGPGALESRCVPQLVLHVARIGREHKLLIVTRIAMAPSTTAEARRSSWQHQHGTTSLRALREPLPRNFAKDSLRHPIFETMTAGDGFRTFGDANTQPSANSAAPLIRTPDPIKETHSGGTSPGQATALRH